MVDRIHSPNPFSVIPPKPARPDHQVTDDRERKKDPREQCPPDHQSQNRGDNDDDGIPHIDEYV